MLPGALLVILLAIVLVAPFRTGLNTRYPPSTTHDICWPVK